MNQRRGGSAESVGEPDREDGGEPNRLADPADARSNCGVGVVMDLDGDGGHGVVADGLELLENLEHRGTTGAEANTGDGAGILLRTPRAFLADEVPVDLPDVWAVGSVFLPQEETAAGGLRSLFESVLADHGLDVVHWRDVPTDGSDLGATALASEPAVVQPVVVPGDGLEPVGEGESTAENDLLAAFDRALYVGRRAVEHAVKERDPPGADRFYVVSLDRQTLVYKGLLKGTQLAGYYPELRDGRVGSTFVLVHARFSTNTLGAWHLAHPYRRLVHNGEFNTIQGNVNWMRAREPNLADDGFGADLEAVLPVVDDPGQSDTASVDNVVELLLRAGRDLPHALRMLVPEAWRGDDAMPADRKAFYDFHASLVEPWDGPALVVATDGERVGAVLDRNGLRPCRYDVTADGRLVMASEVGALETPAADLVERGRLKPGQLFLADPEAGRVVPDEEVFDDLADDRYADWVESEQVRGEDLFADASDGDGTRASDAVDDLRATQAAFGYTHDELDELVEPMARDGSDPVGSMGDDTPLSVLSAFDRPLFSYFKQRFAQVSNPPIDDSREALVTSLESRLGRQRNLLDESPAHARQLVLDSPVLTDAETAALDGLDDHGLSATSVDLTFAPDVPLESAVERVRADAAAAVDAGHDVVVLSDRRVGPDRLAVPSLLATAGVHHHLVREGLRARAGLVVESADPRQVHHLAALVGYGADAVNPYLALATVEDLVAGPDGPDPEAAVAAYVDALEKGLRKTTSKMGISTVESYRGAQIFEAVGLDSGFVAEYFEGTPARTEGVGLAEVEADLRERHAAAFGEGDRGLDRQGEFEFRSTGLHHQWNPKTVGALQGAVQAGDYEGYGEFAALVNDQSETLQTLRGLLALDSDRDPVPVEDVEPVAEILPRFSTAAMSLGSLSPEAHANNARAMHRTGGKANTGEGGEPVERFDTDAECAVKQVASGRFGVTSRYLQSADELQIKMAQGSKPGEGGHLPGHKVNETIASVRHSTPGVGLISPPPQHDVYSIEDLKQLVHDLTAANPDADVNVKLVAEAGVGVVAAGCAKANADVVHVSGHSGGTGASPRTSIKNAGVPWELGLAEANQLLRETGLRSRVRLSVDGGLKTGRDVAVAALLGAEEFVFGTASLVTSGCVMARQCHENTCPVGVATQDPELRDRFPGEPDHVVNYLTFVARELRELMAESGFRTVEEMVGRVDALRQREDVAHPKARRVDLSAVLAEPAGDDRVKTREQVHEVDALLDRELLQAAGSAVADGDPVRLDAAITNRDRSVGALLSNRVSAAHGHEGLPDDTVVVDFDGTAGQSFGAFLAGGVSFDLAGAANDYVGKGLSGGRVVVRTPADAGFDPAANTVVGNVALYGATAGECYVEGVAGERFAVRNSGATAVVEGVGDHGCEYMTGGIVAVLGETGRNFAAGMSGGVAYVHDPDRELADRTNAGMVSLSRDLDATDRRVLRRLVENHAAYAGSDRAAALLADWDDALADFVRVLPDAYAAVIEERAREDVRESPPARACDDGPAPAMGAGD